MITSHAPRDPWDVEVLASQEAGLLFPSVVRCPKVFGLDQSLILRRLGRLAMSDWVRVQARFREIGVSLVRCP